MAISLPSWVQSYQPTFEAHNLSGDVTGATTPLTWGQFITLGSIGMTGAPPWVASIGVATPAGFPSTQFGLDPVTVATTMAASWKAWFLSILWTVPPPLPPFSVITSVVSSSIGATTAEVILFTELLAEFLIPAPPEPNAAWIIKATALSTLFYTATITAGIDLIGIGLTPFPPLTLFAQPII